MRLTFEATETERHADGYAVVCGVRGPGGDGDTHHLLFQRSVSNDDEGYPDFTKVHLEYDGQAFGGYGCIARCVLERDGLRVDLSRQLGGLKGVTGFDLRLRLDERSLHALRAGLEQVFSRETESLDVPW